MRFSKSLATITLSAAALTALSGCTSGGEPAPTQEGEAADSETARADIGTALMTTEDLTELTAEYGEFEETELEQASSDSMIDGDPTCADYLDTSYAAASTDEARTAFRAEFEAEVGDDPAYLFVFSSIREFADTDDAVEGFDTLRDDIAGCNIYTLDLEGTEVEIEVLNSGEAEESLDAGDEGLTLATSEVTGSGNLTGEYAYVMTRVDDVIVTTGAYKAGYVMPIDIELMTEITTAGVDRAQEYLDAA